MAEPFFLIKDSGLISVYYKCGVNDTFVKSTQEKVNPRHWSKKHQRATSACLEAESINRRLDEIALKVKDIARLIKADELKPTKELMNRYWDAYKKNGFFEYACSYIRKFDNEDERGTFILYLAKLGKLATYLGGNSFGKLTKEKLEEYKKIKNHYCFPSAKKVIYAPPFAFSQINNAFLRDYNTYLKSLGNKPNSRSQDFKKIRAIYNQAEADKIVKKENNPFDYFKLEYNETQSDFLSDSSLQKLRLVYLEEGSLEWHARNIWLLNFNMMGRRIGDALVMRREEISEDGHKYTMRKTGDIFDIKFTAEAREIISKYTRGEGYVFPFLSTDESKPLYDRIKIAVAKINMLLKTIAKKADIPEVLKTHTARHTFSQRARKKVSVDLIQQMLGHESLTTTKAYLGRLPNEDLNEANKKIHEDSIMKVV